MPPPTLFCIIILKQCVYSKKPTSSSKNHLVNKHTELSNGVNCKLRTLVDEYQLPDSYRLPRYRWIDSGKAKIASNILSMRHRQDKERNGKGTFFCYHAYITLIHQEYEIGVLQKQNIGINGSPVIKNKMLK